MATAILSLALLGVTSAIGIIGLGTTLPLSPCSMLAPASMGRRGLELSSVSLHNRPMPKLLRMNFEESKDNLLKISITQASSKRIPSQEEAANTASIIEHENRFVAQNYAPLPIVFSRGSGVWLWDVNERQYLDLLGAYSVVSQGHSHPRILYALVNQALRLATCSRAIHNDQLSGFAEYITSLLGYDRVLVMNTGAEAFDTALKLSRRWGYAVKGVEQDHAKVVVLQGNFHGRTLGAIAASDASSSDGFGPHLPGFIKVPFNDVDALEDAFKDESVVAFIFEPIQGEAGVRIPSDGYLQTVRQLCNKYNVLFVADEVQTGLGRTGRMLACDHEGVRPDVVMLAKALSGGMMPISAVLADDDIMLNIKPGQHGSTFGGNAIASAVALESLKVIVEEDLVSRSAKLGEFFLEGLRKINSPYIKNIRGRGLFLAFDVEPKGNRSARNIVMSALERGVLFKETHSHTIRLAPPFIITEDEIRFALDVIQQAIDEYGSD